MNVFRGGKASGAFFVALGHFVTNVVGLHAAEVNFWAERRSYSHQDSLVAQFPRGRDGEWPSLGKVLSPSLSESVTKTLPSAFLHEHAALLAALPYQHGTVRKVSFPSVRRSPSSVVILIQDVHMNADAQAHIGRAVESLIQQKQAGLVLLEGAFAPFNFSPLRHYSRPKTLRKLADFLLQHNRISGPVHAAATCSADIPDFVGVDDEGHYQANVAAYTSSVPQAADNKKWIADRLADLERQKDAEFNPDLRGFDRVVLGYGEGSLLLGDYLRALAKHSKTLPSQILTAHHPHPALGGEGPLRATFPQEGKETGDFPSPLGRGQGEGPGHFPQISLFLRALDLESSLDFPQIEAARARLMERLVQRLDRQQIDDLTKQSVAYRLGQIRYADFYRRFRGLCESHAVSLSQFPELDRYIRYVLLADQISAEDLFAQATALEKHVYARLAKSEREKRLVAYSHYLRLTAKLIDFSLTPDEWSAFAENEGQSFPDLSPFKNFYLEAQARDGAMAHNVLEAMGKASGDFSGKASVVVAGGFHSAGLTRVLTQAGCTVISFMPKIEKLDSPQGSAYLDVFTREKTPLEKLFQGQKLFLATDPIAGFRGARYGLAVIEAAGRSSTAEQRQVIEETLRQFGAVPDYELAVESDSKQPNTVDVVLSSEGVDTHLVTSEEGRILDCTSAPSRRPASWMGRARRRVAAMVTVVPVFFGMQGAVYPATVNQVVAPAPVSELMEVKVSEDAFKQDVTRLTREVKEHAEEWRLSLDTMMAIGGPESVSFAKDATSYLFNQNTPSALLAWQYKQFKPEERIELFGRSLAIVFRHGTEADRDWVVRHFRTDAWAEKHFKPEGQIFAVVKFAERYLSDEERVAFWGPPRELGLESLAQTYSGPINFLVIFLGPLLLAWDALKGYHAIRVLIYPFSFLRTSWDYYFNSLALSPDDYVPLRYFINHPGELVSYLALRNISFPGLYDWETHEKIDHLFKGEHSLAERIYGAWLIGSPFGGFDPSRKFVQLLAKHPVSADLFITESWRRFLNSESTTPSDYVAVMEWIEEAAPLVADIRGQSQSNWENAFEEIFNRRIYENFWRSDKGERQEARSLPIENPPFNFFSTPEERSIPQEMTGGSVPRDIVHEFLDQSSGPPSLSNERPGKDILRALEDPRVTEYLLSFLQHTAVLEYAQLVGQLLVYTDPSRYMKQLVRLLSSPRPIVRMEASNIFRKLSIINPVQTARVLAAEFQSPPAESVLPKERGSRPHVGIIIRDRDWSVGGHGDVVRRVIEGHLHGAEGISFFPIDSQLGQDLNISEIEKIVEDHSDHVFIFHQSMGPAEGLDDPQEVNSYSVDWVKKMGRKGVIYVYSIGNRHGMGIKTHTPLDNILAIAAVDKSGEREPYSSFSQPEYVFGAANPPAWAGKGTSFSAPVVTGILAKMLSSDKGISPKDAVERLASKCQPIGSRYFQLGLLGNGLIPSPNLLLYWGLRLLGTDRGSAARLGLKWGLLPEIGVLAGMTASVPWGGMLVVGIGITLFEIFAQRRVEGRPPSFWGSVRKLAVFGFYAPFALLDPLPGFLAAGLVAGGVHSVYDLWQLLPLLRFRFAPAVIEGETPSSDRKAGIFAARLWAEGRMNAASKLIGLILVPLAVSTVNSLDGRSVAMTEPSHAVFAEAFYEESERLGLHVAEDDLYPVLTGAVGEVGQARHLPTVHVVQGIVKSGDLSAVEGMVQSVKRANENGVPMRLLLVPGDNAMRTTLAHMSLGPNVFVRSNVPLEAGALAADFEQWQRDSLQGAPVQLVITLSDGLTISGNIPGGSLYAQALKALREALARDPIQPAQFNQILAAFVALAVAA